MRNDYIQEKLYHKINFYPTNWRIEPKLAKVFGVRWVRISLDNRKMAIEFENFSISFLIREWLNA